MHGSHRPRAGSCSCVDRSELSRRLHLPVRTTVDPGSSGEPGLGATGSKICLIQPLKQTRTRYVFMRTYIYTVDCTIPYPRTSISLLRTSLSGIGIPWKLNSRFTSFTSSLIRYPESRAGTRRYTYSFVAPHLQSQPQTAIQIQVSLRSMPVDGLFCCACERETLRAYRSHACRLNTPIPDVRDT